MPAPDITFQNEKGKTIHLDKLKGKITLIDFGQVGVALVARKFLM